MCLGILKPTPGRLVVFLVFALAPVSGILSFLPPLQLYFSIPYIALWQNRVLAIIAQLIYSYVLGCIYLAAYFWLEAKIRKSYPHMDDIVKKPAARPNNVRRSTKAKKIARKR